MKRIVKAALLCAGLLPCHSIAQDLDIDWNLYPDYSPKMYPDYSLLSNKNSTEETPLPDHVHNGQTKFFPPVFNQAGGSCSMASRIGYMFTYEMNAYHNANGKLPANRYPSHFVWLMSRGNSGKYALIQHVGVPSCATYGGATYSHLFGNQKPTDNNFGWMQGYEKWYSAMFNRMLCPSHFPLSLKTEEGRIALKRWLYNHNNDQDYFGGGVAGIGVGINGTRKPIPNSPTNDEIGVAGMQYMEKWGAKFNHALTIVGYDDRIEFDLDGNGVVGEKDKDEVGAWIIVNSWGSRWANNGFIYCPYANAIKTSSREHWWFPEIFKVRKNYRPLRTAKIRMDYSHRSEIAISAGISTDLNATQPEKTIPFHHFQYAGDGKKGRSNPAPAIPMLGKWADGLHNEPMEFGYDLTDLSSYFNKNMPLKYFLIVETCPWAQGKGKIYEASIIDYEFDKEGIQVPFDIANGGVSIQNKGNKTIISTIVSGESYHEPQNLTYNNDVLKWDVPHTSIHKIEGYRIYCNNVLLQSVSPNTTQFTLPKNEAAITYSLSAVYENSIESSKVNVNVPVNTQEVNECINLAHSGFSIPNIFNSKYAQTTIEFWIRPNSLVDYNQAGGPGWEDSFKFHANAIGAFTVGWDNNNRVTSPAGALKVGQWSHIAAVFNQNKLDLYVNGKLANSFTSNEYNGIGGFEELDFGSSEEESNMDAAIDEVRIWNYARTAEEIGQNKDIEYFGRIMPKGLMGYYKGGTTDIEGLTYLRDYAGANHARIITRNFTPKENTELTFSTPSGELKANIIAPMSAVYCGLPVRLTANYSEVIDQLCWNAPDANVEELYTNAPSLTFTQTGKHVVTLTASNAKGESVTDQCEINVENAPAPDATFNLSQDKISSGEHITFIAAHPMVGYLYEWSMPGSSKEKAYTPNAATTYSTNGNYKVTLTVTSPDGKKASQEREISVIEVTPVAEFEVAPSVIVKGETTFLTDKSKYKPTQWEWQIHNDKRDFFINGQNSSFTPENPGVFDITLSATNSTGTNKITHKRALIVCNADSKSGLLFSSDGAAVKLSKPLFINPTRAMTFDCWMNPLSLKSPCYGFGEEGKFMLTTSFDGVMTLKIGTATINSPKNFVTDNEWHHYALSFDNGKISFYRDGQLQNEQSVAVTAIPEIRAFTIGGNKAPLDGQIDELRIWGTALNKEKIQAYANAPIENIEEACSTDSLMLYYDFNQSGGNVEDRTAHHNDGIRQGFGPDGDAWGLSQGVFCLDLVEKDITHRYLKNYTQPFKYDGAKIVNPSQGSRFHAIADWKLNNMAVDGNVTTAAHVDAEKYNSFTITTKWDGFGELKDHKAFQTISLPAGAYTFIANYTNKKTKVRGNTQLYLVVAEGQDLPNTDRLDKAIAYKKMETVYVQHSNQVEFELDQDTEVSLGLLVNMTDSSCVTLSSFRLEQRRETQMEADNANGFDLQIDATRHQTLCLPYPTSIPNNVTAYLASAIEGNQVIMEPIDDGILPGKTGALIIGDAGTYHFTPSATSSNRKSLLYGVLADEATDSGKRYYSIDAEQTPVFRLNHNSTLEANHAYLVREAEDDNETYPVRLNTVGIEKIEDESQQNVLYDLGGRRVNAMQKGVYIVNNKKMIIK